MEEGEKKDGDGDLIMVREIADYKRNWGLRDCDGLGDLWWWSERDDDEWWLCDGEENGGVIDVLWLLWIAGSNRRRRRWGWDSLGEKMVSAESEGREIEGKNRSVFAVSLIGTEKQLEPWVILQAESREER